MLENSGCVLDQNNGARKLMSVIGDKWSILIIYALQERIVRFNALERMLPGISQKMLSQSLKSLERSGLIERTVFPEVPPRVEYKLTTLGRTLLPITDSICTWADRYSAELRIRA
jgi:DNA-binding HxlR family transcriptional regulator